MEHIDEILLLTESEKYSANPHIRTMADKLRNAIDDREREDLYMNLTIFMSNLDQTVEIMQYGTKWPNPHRYCQTIINKLSDTYPFSDARERYIHTCVAQLKYLSNIATWTIQEYHILDKCLSDLKRLNVDIE